MAFLLACLVRSSKNDTSVDVSAVVKNYRMSLGEHDGKLVFFLLLLQVRSYMYAKYAASYTLSKKGIV